MTAAVHDKEAAKAAEAAAWPPVMSAYGNGVADGVAAARRLAAVLKDRPPDAADYQRGSLTGSMPLALWSLPPAWAYTRFTGSTTAAAAPVAI